MPLRDIIVWLLHLLIRFCEWLLRPGLLRMTAWPVAAILSTAEWRQRKQLEKAFQRTGIAGFPILSLRRAIWRQRVRHHLYRIILFFPDRLSKPRWQKRFRVTGREHLSLPLGRKEPILIACFHFGALMLLRYWLRAAGIPAATLMGNSIAKRTRSKQRKDRISGDLEIPHTFAVDQLKQANRYLELGNCLMVALDHPSGRQVRTEHGDTIFQMATGAIRMAARSRAKLVPCTIVEESAWCFFIEIGQPVPEQVLQSSELVRAASSHLLEEMMRVVERHPDQCGLELLNRLETQPTAADPAS